MIPDIAIITGAGWKPFNEACSKDPDIVPHRTPELLWPLGDGHTVLSRLAAQFRAIGIQRIWAGVGEPGHSPTRAVEDRQGQAWGFDRLEGYGEPVWTRERISYVESIGVGGFTVRDPHAVGKTCWNTLAEILDYLSEHSWQRLLICAGDYIFKTAYLYRLIREAVYPSQVWLWPKHSVEFLDYQGTEALLGFLSELGTSHQGKVYLSRDQLAQRGVKIIDFPCPPKSQPEARRQAFRELRQGWFEIGVYVRKMREFVAPDPIKGG